ncbi:MAG TPA: lysophospholipid acyltransferase family protein [Gemmatimonadales bacterium]|nr:lysophospholipid acyltransferase family protein [Gemmatimonadales bacterium]
MRLRPSPATVARLAPPIVGALARTWRYREEGDQAWRGFLAARRPFVVALWHDILLMPLWRHRDLGVAIVVSEARDGQYLADVAARFGFGAVRGSSTRGGSKALLGALRVLGEGGVVAFTPDGPRGPRRVLKPGVVAAAQQAGVPVVPVHAVPDRAWRFRSWDRFCLPKPFARVRLGYGTPVDVAPGAAGLSAGVAAVVGALDRLARDLGETE